MTSRPQDSQVPSAIRDKLASLRTGIRWYVAVHGLMLAIAWLCLTYWVLLLLDYGPVLLGFSEMPRPTRIVLLVVVGAGLAWILYRWVFRRVFVPFRDQSLALVLERRFPGLQDSLATVVQSKTSQEGMDNLAQGAGEDYQGQSQNQAQLQQAVVQRAVKQLESVLVRDVFTFRPLLIVSVAAALLMISVGWLVASYPDTFATSLRRLYLADQNPWPRQCQVEIVGIKIKHELPVEILPEMDSVLPLRSGRVIVGQASDVMLMVRAAAPSVQHPQRQLPRSCEFRYWTDDGGRGVLPMNKMGGPRDGYQMFTLEGQVLNGILSNINFYVRGGDHRIGPFQITTVPNPVVVQTELDCEFPSYMIDRESMRWTPRTVDWRNGTKLPLGTRVNVRCHANRKLQFVYILDEDGQLEERLDLTTVEQTDEATFQFCYPIENLNQPVRVSYWLQASDGVLSQRPHVVSIGMIQDEPPTVDARLSGIGSAVTPSVRIPFYGQILDDYGVAEARAEIRLPNDLSLSVDCELDAHGDLNGVVDFLELRREDQQPIDLPTTADSQIHVTVMARDHFDLDPERPNGQVGLGDRYVLDVVTPDRLLRILERLEASQRRRLEQIQTEMTEVRQFLTRSHSGQDEMIGYEPGDAKPLQHDPAQSARADLDLAQLFVQRALLQTQKSMHEVLGVAAAFSDIRLQLINNRVDSEDRKARLEQSVVDPLEQIGNQSLPQLESLLLDQDARFESVKGDRSTALLDEIENYAQEAIAQTDVVLLQIQQVLDSLQKFETQNELLDLVRRMIEDQQQLLQRTKAERNRQAFEGLLN